MSIDEREPDDAVLVEELRAAGFSGLTYDRMEERLAAYAIDVLDGMFRKRTIYRAVAARAFPLQPTHEEALLLCTSEADRMELVLDATADGLVLFRRKGLEGGEWSPELGASLRTYFVGACLMCLPNVFRRWQRSRSHLRSVVAIPVETLEMVAPADRIPAQRDMADRVADRLQAEEELERMPPQIREAMVRMALYGESVADVAAIVGMSPRALEGRIHRYKAKRRGEASA
jgi:hypothetical protein